MSKINKQYIYSAIRIRKEYFIELEKIKEKEKILNQYKGEINNIYSLLEGMVKDYNGIVETDEPFQKELNSKLNDIERVMLQTQKELQPNFEKIESLKEESTTLYNNILEKYPGITQEEIQDQIIPLLDKE